MLTYAGEGGVARELAELKVLIQHTSAYLSIPQHTSADVMPNSRYLK
jgi:hypothetical protein